VGSVAGSPRLLLAGAEVRMLRGAGCAVKSDSRSRRVAGL